MPAEPNDPLDRDIWPCWHHAGWENAAECSMQVAEGKTRAEARQACRNDLGSWTEIGVWKRYIVPVTRQEAWKDWGTEYWPAGPAAAPDVVPADWDPGYLEGRPTWKFVPSGTPGAVAYWVCGEVGHPPPAPPTRADGIPEFWDGDGDSTSAASRAGDER